MPPLAFESRFVLSYSQPYYRPSAVTAGLSVLNYPASNIS
jgi:hypothetical protein